MGGQDSDKTEEPTEHKLQEARKKGQVMKSQEVISTCLLLATAGAMYGAGGGMLSRIRELTVYIWGMIPTYNIASSGRCSPDRLLPPYRLLSCSFALQTRAGSRAYRSSQRRKYDGCSD